MRERETIAQIAGQTLRQTGSRRGEGGGEGGTAAENQLKVTLIVIV